MDLVKIPFGYKRVVGQLQKGDGILDLATGGFIKVKRVPVEVIIKKTKMQYPCVMPYSGEIAIRRCTVEQPSLPGVSDSPCQNPGCPNVIADQGEDKCPACGHFVRSE